MMEKYHIENCGCDDTSEFDIELSDDELKTIIKFVDANNKVADYFCKPDIRIYKFSDDRRYYYKDSNMLNKTYKELNDLESELN